MIKSCRHLQSQTSHKNHGLFKDFAAPNKFFPGPFFSIDRDSNREKAVMNQTLFKKIKDLYETLLMRGSQSRMEMRR